MIPKQLMESKLITDEQWEEYLELKESSTWWSNRFNAVERDKRELKHNWNELKEHIKDVLDMYKETDDQYVKSQREFGIRDGYKSIELKMQELEKWR